MKTMLYTVQIERSLKNNPSQSVGNPYSFYLHCPVAFSVFAKADACARKLAIHWQRNSRKYDYRCQIVESEWDVSANGYRLKHLHPIYGASLLAK